MKALIAEDSEEKIEDLNNYLVSLGFFSKLDISKSFKETIGKLLSEEYDIVLLDMTMPTKGVLNNKPSKMRTLAGKDVLSTLNYYKIDVKCIIFSQFGEFGKHGEIETLDEIYNYLKVDYGKILIGCIKYSSADASWKTKLSKVIQENFSND